MSTWKVKISKTCKSLEILIPRQTAHELGLVRRQRMLFMLYKNGLKAIPLEAHQVVAQTAWTKVRNLGTKEQGWLRVVLPSAMCRTLGLKARDTIKIRLTGHNGKRFLILTRPDEFIAAMVLHGKPSIHLVARPVTADGRLTRRSHASKQSCRTRMPQKDSAGWKDMMQVNSQKRLKRICELPNHPTTRPRNRASRIRFRRKSNFNN